MSQYAELGVDAGKGFVEDTFGSIINKDQFPYAFCNITLDPWNPDIARTLKKDGDGSKSVIRCLHFLENGKPAVFQGIIDDAFAMAAGDAGASGLLGALEIADTIDINGFNVPKDIILPEIQKSLKRIIALHEKAGIRIFMSGGETADLPIQVNSVVTNMAIRASAKASYVVRGDIQEGDVIYGFASGGRARWEETDACELMSNGFTLANRVLLHPDNFNRRPFLRHPKKKNCGRFRLNDKPNILRGKTIGNVLCSSTRQWTIVQKALIDELLAKRSLPLLHGITLNSGGGATKDLRLGDRIRFVKNMPIPAGVFRLIQKEGQVEWPEMYMDFNCGIGMDIIGSAKNGVLHETVRSVAKKLNIAWYELGTCCRSSCDENEIILITPYGKFGKKKSDKELIEL